MSESNSLEKPVCDYEQLDSFEIFKKLDFNELEFPGLFEAWNEALIEGKLQEFIEMPDNAFIKGRCD
jgi:hypothetical protein